MNIKHPLTSSQYDIWVDQQISSQSPLYNIGGYINIKGSINFEIFSKSINMLINRNDALRLNFFIDDKMEPYQIISNLFEYKIDFIDFSQKKEPFLYAKKWINDEFQIPFSLIDSFLFKLCLIKISDNHFLFFNKYHHLIIDGWGLSITIDQIINMYNSLLNKEIPFEEAVYSYTKYIEDNNIYLISERCKIAEEFWKSKLKYKPDSILSSPLFNYPKSINSNSNRRSINIKSRDFKKLIDIGKSFNVTTFTVLLSLLYIYLHKITQFNDIIIGIPLLNRSRKSFKKTVGLFVDSSPLMINIDSSKSINNILLEVKVGLAECYRHQRFPAGQIERIANTNSLNRLYDVVLSYEKHSYEKKFNNFETETITVSNYSQNNALTIHVEEYQDGEDVILNFDHRSDIFKDFSIEDFTNQFEILYKDIIQNPNSSIADLNILPEEDHNLLFKVFNNNSVDYPSDKTIVDMFEEQVEKTPNNIAIIYDDVKLSYRELNEKSNKVGHYLIENQIIKSGDLIGLMLDRSPNMIIALLGILKSGAAYVPIDPEYPENRKDYILKDSNMKSVISEFDDGIYLNINNMLISESNTSNLTNLQINKSPIYVIYTSGTTGNPKGTVISHNNYVNYISWAKDHFFNNDKSGNFGLFTSISFDLTTTSIFLSILRGKTLKIFNQKVEISTILTEVFNSDIIDSVKLTPSHISILSSLEIHNDNTELVIVGGEELLNDHIKILKTINSDIKIFNEYGPTEATVGCVVKQINDTDKRIHIGKPISNTYIYILDKDLHLLPIGVPGEIFIGGSGVGVGYLNRIDLTIDKFISNPFNPDERIYKTGDYGLWLPDGNIEFLGRIDDQVKIRGFRIELSEIENALLKHPEINNTVVTVNNKTNGDKYLSAYYVAKDHLAITTIRTFLGITLPDFMIPSVFIHMDSLSLTVNGKIDKKILPDPELNSKNVEHIKALNEEDKKLFSIIRAVLSLSDIGLDDNFYNLGGDSIKAIQISNRLLNEGYILKSNNILSNPLIKDMSNFMVLKDELVSVNQKSSKGNVGQTPIIRWFFSLNLPIENHYNQSVLLKLKTNVEIDALEEIFHFIVCHHDSLRLNFNYENDCLFYNSSFLNEKININHFDLSKYEYSRQLDEIKKIGYHIKSNFNLERDLLFNSCIFKLDDKNKLLLLNAHHLIIDGISWRILLNDLKILLNQHYNNEEFVLPSKTSSYQDWSLALKDYSKNEFPVEKQYWENNENFDSYSMFNIKNSTKIDAGICTITKELSFKLTQKLLKEANLAYKTTADELMIIALLIILNNRNENGEIKLELERHGRAEISNQLNIDRTIGWFTSIFNASFNVPKSNDLNNTIKSLKEQIRSIPDNDISYGILKYSKREIKSNNVKLIRFNYLGDFDNNFSNDYFGIADFDTGSDVSKNNSLSSLLDINCLVVNNVFKISITFENSMFFYSDIEQLIDDYLAELEKLINHCIVKDEIEFTPSDFDTIDLSQDELNLLFN